MAERIKSLRGQMVRVFLVAAIAIAVWEMGGLISPADAQSGASLPNAAAQREMLIKLQQQQNQQILAIYEKLEKLDEHLQSGDLEVRVTEVRTRGSR